MRKRSLVIMASLLLVAALCFAQAPRDTSGNQITQTVTATSTSNLITGGLDVSGNPSWVALSDGSGFLHYLWVDDTGDLMIASYTTTSSNIGSVTSFPNGDWNGQATGFESMGGTVVGGQS